MFSVKIKDIGLREFDRPLNGFELSKELGLKNIVIMSINNAFWDLSRPIPDTSEVEIITREDTRMLEVIRHDCAHVLAQAVKRLFKDVQITIGPSIEHGFYYDIYKPTPFVPDDLQKIEAEMHKIIKEDFPFLREVWEKDKAIEFFKNQQEHFKVEIIQDLPEGSEITLYRQGDFVDLCRGPHMPSTRYIGKAFKLTKLAGAYWRGDSNKPMLQRIYGTAWATQEQLDDYLHQLEEAEKRDHRKLGPQLGLFHMQEEAPGCAFWHPKGWQLYRLLETYMRKRLENAGYVEVKTPQILDKSLWQASGHWDHYRENMFVIPDENERAMVVKPMNCPCHVQIFKQGIKSYRDLPLRMAEFGSCHRNEAKGALHGLMRVRAFTQDDAHIFCTPDQILEETKEFCTLLRSIYKDLGFDEVRIELSTWPEKRAVSDDVCELAEQALIKAAEYAGISYTLNPGDGAFYGPKLDFHLKDAIGRSWQCGTLQVDFVLPERLGAHYIDENGEKKHPVMLHRAILGTFERFLGILIEHHNGQFPMWLTPVQVAVASITSDVCDYAEEVFNILEQRGLRAVLDNRNEQISYKVREHSLQKIPYIIVVGKKEKESRKISVRQMGSTNTETFELEAWIENIKALSAQPK